MPRVNNQLPNNGSNVRFRVAGEKILRSGKYEDNKFKACSPFLCVDIEGVDYWRYTSETKPNPPGGHAG